MVKLRADKVEITEENNLLHHLDGIEARGLPEKTMCGLLV
jgi:hypothetical protein